jgi:hypothetical protein
MSSGDRLTKRPSELATQSVQSPNKTPRRIWTRRRVTVLVAVLVVLSAGWVAFISTPFGYNLVSPKTSQPVVATALATNKPHSSPTAASPSTISANSPVLGGSWQAFDNLFGAGNLSTLGWQYQGRYGPMVSKVWGYNGCCQEGNPTVRVTDMEIYPNNAPNWSLSQAQTVVAQFFPADAKLRSTKQIYQGQVPKGIEETYTSVLLARTLPRVDFTNANDKQAEPGTFYVYLADGLTASSGIDGAEVGTEEYFILPNPS